VNAPTSTAAAGTARFGALREVLDQHRVVVCTGSGGVGKTTAAAVLALSAARAGRRAVVVTIDPAKRLADALGLGQLTNDARVIDGDWPGDLSALMLDTKHTFDALVRRYAATPDQAEGILANRFYRNIAGALSGTQEYMAMEKLYELHDSGDFDVIVVDTPPTRNALDFIDAPNRLNRLLEHRLFRFVIAPTRAYLKAVNVAAQAFLKTIGRVVGTEVVRDVIAFFQAFEGMEEGFRTRSSAVLELLASDDTAFVLVASPRPDTVNEARYFGDQLSEAGITVRALVVNRMHPSFGSSLSGADRHRADSLTNTPLGALYQNLADFRTIAEVEESTIDPLVAVVAPAPVVRVPFLDDDVHDLAGLDRVAEHLLA
jgi:anion-transporting  ArsA/GET3 family ATPase